MNEKTIWQKLQTIDSRIIYGILIACILLPLLFPLKLPILPSQQSEEFYATVEKIAKTDPNKIVIVDGQWAPGTRGENQWQTVAILNHLMQRHIHFAILSFDTQNNTITQGLAESIAAKYGYVYGRDYVNWGYRPFAVFTQTLKGLVNNIPGTIKKDWKGKPIADFPVMQGIKDIQDVKGIVEITPSGTLDTWIGLVQGVNKTPVLYAPTAVMAPDSYSYLDSGQISGLLTGVKGAGDYEKLTGVTSFGTKAAGALSLVYALIILLIIIGNIGYFQQKAAEKRGQA